MKRRHIKALTIFSWVAIIAISGVSLLLIVWLLMPYQVTSIEEPIQILNPNKEVRLGEAILQELKISKPNDIPPTDTTRVLVCDDGNLVSLASLPNTLNLPMGEYTLRNDRYVLPPKVIVGSKCTFVWRQTYQVNPIKKIPVEWRSELFTVLPAK